MTTVHTDLKEPVLAQGRRPYRLAYVARHAYPDDTAAAGQSIQMAAALAKQVEAAAFYVHDMPAPDPTFARYPGVADSAIRVKAMGMSRLPRALYSNSRFRFSAFNSGVALKLLGQYRLCGRPAFHNLLFVRSRLESLYWGLMRPYLPWLRNWTFIFEAHDVAGLDPEAVIKGNPFDGFDGPGGARPVRTRNALGRFDVVLCVTQALAENLMHWSNGEVRPHVVRHASGLARVTERPEVGEFSDNITLGYVGTIDRVRGVDTLMTAMRRLPDRFRLRLVGRVPERGRSGGLPNWMTSLISDPDIGPKVEVVPPKPLTEVGQEIDQCDILLQPASDDLISLRYRAPLKVFDYMVRGKPIVAADVPCHSEILTDGFNALLYRHGDDQHLASRIEELARSPRKANEIAGRAWEQSEDYTYGTRARRVLDIVEAVLNSRCSASVAGAGG